MAKHFDLTMPQRLSKCTSPAEISAAHAEFYKETVKTISRYFTEITELGQKAMGQVKENTNQNPTGKA